MREIFQSDPQPAIMAMPSGALRRGTAVFSLFLYDAGESVPQTPDGYPRARSLRYWRGNVQRGQPLTVAPPSTYQGAPAVVIPASVLEKLADDANLAMRWHWTASEVQP